MKRLIPVAALTVVVIAAACKPNLKVQTDLPEATAHIESALREVAKVDPLALNKLLNENQDLRKTVELARAKLIGVSEGLGVIELKGRKLKIEILHHTGSIRVTGWIDTPNNWFWQSRVFNDQAITLPINGRKVLNDFQRPLLKRLAPIKDIDANQIPNIGETPKDEIAGLFQAEVNRAFRTFLKDTPIIPRPDSRTIDLHDQLGGSGEHVVALDVIPLTRASASGRWSVRGRMLSVPPQGEPDVIKEFDLDSDQFKNHPMETPLPTIKVLIRVKTTTG